MTTFFSHSRLSRRRFLKDSALTAGALAGAGALLDACDTSSSSAGGKTTLTIMSLNNEVLPAYLTEFEKLNPDVKINFLNFDQTRLNAMFAAGSPPDIIRGVGFDSPYNSARGLALNLDPYLAKSSVLKVDDFMPIQGLWRWDGKQSGQGPYYGLAKDWSPDGGLWCNGKLFQQQGIAMPSTSQPLSFDEVLALGKQLTIRQGGKIEVYGIDAEWPNAVTVGTGELYQMVAQQGGRIFSSDLTKADFTTPEALKALQWYVDYAQAHIGPSPFDPDPNGWDGPTYLANRMAISLDGYWFGGQIATGSADLQAASVLLPAPQMGTKRVSSCYSATGHWIAANSKQKDLAWKFFEYFYTGKPAHDRATSGWGVPPLKSLLSEMPQATAGQKSAYHVVQDELQYFVSLPVSPYTTSAAVGSVIDQYLQQVVKKEISLSTAAQQITSGVNLLLHQGQQTAG